MRKSPRDRGALKPSKQVCIAAIAWVACASALSAQRVSGDPGIVIHGRVLVKVLVTLSDEQAPYHPVVGLPLRFLRTGGDSVALLTDDAGVALTTLPPGEYSLVSARTTSWGGRQYTWKLPITVRAGTGAINLTKENAQVAAFAGRVATRAVAAPPPTSVPATALPPGPNADVRTPSVAQPRARSTAQAFYGSIEPSFVVLLSDRKRGSFGPSGNGVGADAVAHVGVGLISLGLGYIHTWNSYEGASEFNRISGVIVEPRLQLSRRDRPTTAYVFARAGAVSESFESSQAAVEGNGVVYGAGAGVLRTVWPRVRLNVAAGIHRAEFKDLKVSGTPNAVLEETHTSLQIRVGVAVR